MAPPASTGPGDLDLALVAGQRRQLDLERIVDGERAGVTDLVVVEAALTIRARGRAVATVMRTPGHDLELVRGLLHAEGVATGPGGVRAPTGQADVVEVDADPAAFAPRATIASAACGVCGREAIADLEQRARDVRSGLIVPAAFIAELPARIRAAQAVFADTGGLHAAALVAASGELRVLREDVGRHNAVDKVAGWALHHGVDAGQCVLFLSGRLGFELVQKAVMLGVPVVAAVGAPTTLAITIAERFLVAACGFVRDGRMNLYSHAWRIA